MLFIAVLPRRIRNLARYYRFLRSSLAIVSVSIGIPSALSPLIAFSTKATPKNYRFMFGFRGEIL